MNKLFLMSVVVSSFLFADSTTCNVFSNILQTRLANSKITMQSTVQTAYIEHTNNCNLNTTDVYKDNYGHGLVCDENGNYKKDSNESMADATGNLGNVLNINYNFTVANSTASQNPVDISNGDIVINSENEKLSGNKYNSISQNYHNYNFSWSPNGDDIGVNQFENILNTVTISNVDGKDVKIGEFITAKNKNSTTNLYINNSLPANIEIYTLKGQGSNKFTAELNASNKIDINTLQIARNDSNVTLKAPSVVIENLNQTNSGVKGNSVVTIYADNIDIKNINLNQNAKLYIYPYTPDGNVTFHSDNIYSSSSSTIFVSSGKYYTNTFSISGSRDVSSIRAIDNNQKVNFYINGDFKPGNNPGINSNGNNGNFGTLDPVNFKMFINGDLDSGSGGTTFNALVYVEGKTDLGSGTYLQGALSSGNDIVVGNNSKLYWYSSISNSNYGACSNNSNSGITLGEFNVVESSFNSLVDPLDENDTLNQIYTKIVNKSFSVKVIKLKSDNQTLENYTGVVRLDLINKPANQNECNNNIALSKDLVIFNNQSSEIKNLTYDKAGKDLSFRVRYFDFTFPKSCVNLANEINTNPGSTTLTTDTRTCISDLKTVSENTSYNLASCVSTVSSQNITNWNDVNTNNINNVTQSQDNSLMECIFEKANSLCSRDDFAVRPYKYKIKSINQKLISGKDINLTIEALDYDGNLINDFNFSNAPVELNVIDAKGCKTGSFTPKQNSVNFINGEVNLTFNYKDVGDINTSIKEYKNGNEYAAVDENDKVDSNGTTENDDTLLISEGNSTISRFYPDHFAINIIYKNFDDSNFTYISSDLNMSSVLDINITAQNEENGTTYNYNEKCYAKDFDMNISHSIPKELNKNTLILYRVKNGKEYNVSLDKDLNFTNLSKNYFSTDNNGSALFDIYINFEKNYTTPVNEFNFTIQEINVSDDDNITGTQTFDKNATFRYGRIEVQNSSVYGKDINTTLKYEYWTKNKGWIVNTKHNVSTMGAVDISNSYKPADVNIIPLSSTVKGIELINVSTTHSLPYNTKIHLAIPSWLWYHPLAKAYKAPSKTNTDCLTHPCFTDEYLTTSTGWGGISGISNEEFNATKRTVKIKSNNSTPSKASKKGISKLNW